jgi:hypothetical protein
MLHKYKVGDWDPLGYRRLCMTIQLAVGVQSYVQININPQKNVKIQQYT